jgi:hypothetical protein
MKPAGSPDSAVDAEGDRIVLTPAIAAVFSLAPLAGRGAG